MEAPIWSVKEVKYSNLHHMIIHNSESVFGYYIVTWSNLLSIIKKKEINILHFAW